jgi:hypothetical protein
LVAKSKPKIPAPFSRRSLKARSTSPTLNQFLFCRKSSRKIVRIQELEGSFNLCCLCFRIGIGERKKRRQEKKTKRRKKGSRLYACETAYILLQQRS